MRLHELVQPSNSEWRTVGCKSAAVFIRIHVVCLKFWLENTDMSGNTSSHRVNFRFSYCVFACVSVRTSDFCMWHPMFTSCGLALLFVRALLHLISVSALGSSPFEAFIPSTTDLEDLCLFRQLVGPSPQPCSRSLTQHTICYSSHVVMSCQKQRWQMLLFYLCNSPVGLTLMPPLSFTLQSSVCAESVLRACRAVSEQIFDVLKEKKFNIPYNLPLLWKKRLRKQETV